MGYLDETLTQDERVVGKTRLHWIVFVMPACIAGAGAGLMSLGFFGGAHDSLGQIFRPGADWVARWQSLGLDDQWSLYVLGGGLAFALIGSTLWLIVWIRYVTTEFAVTNRRVLLKVGVISRDTIEIVLSKVETIKVRQGIWGRMLGYGSIVVIGTGGSKDEYHRIARPIEFRRDIQAQIALGG